LLLLCQSCINVFRVDILPYTNKQIKWFLRSLDIMKKITIFVSQSLLLKFFLQCHLRYTTQTHLVIVHVHCLDVCYLLFIPWWILRFRLSGFACIIRRNHCPDPPRRLERNTESHSLNKNGHI